MKLKLLTINLLLLFIHLCFFTPLISASTANNTNTNTKNITNTTVYFPSFEKNLTTGEINKYYNVGNITLQRNLKKTTTKNYTDKLYYLFPDHLSSTRLIINKDQTETFYLSYYPYGNPKDLNQELRINNQGINNFYTGQKKDIETNLYYYHARYYNPQTAHFISADKAEGPNRYTYVGNNPIMRNDPSGNQGEFIIGFFCNFAGVDMAGICSNISKIIEAIPYVKAGLRGDLTYLQTVLGVADIIADHEISAIGSDSRIIFYPSSEEKQSVEGIFKRTIASVKWGIIAATTGDIVAGFGGMGVFNKLSLMDNLNDVGKTKLTIKVKETDSASLLKEQTQPCVGPECFWGKVKKEFTPEGEASYFCGGPTQEGCSQVSQLISQWERGSMDGDWVSTQRGIEAWQNYINRLKKVLEKANCPYQDKIWEIINNISHYISH